MKSPAVIYALKIQKDSDHSVAGDFPQDSEQSIHLLDKPMNVRSRKPKKFWLLVLVLTFLLFIMTGVYTLFAQPSEIAITVDSTGDEPDDDPSDGVCLTAVNTCTLRAAITHINSLATARETDAVPPQIRFSIAGAGPHIISPTTELPHIHVPIVIDGSTQPGAVCPKAHQPADLKIVLDGQNAGANADGLVLDTGSDGSTIRGLVIGHFDDDGIRINSNENRVGCNHIGVQADGVSPMGNSTAIFVAGEENEIGGSNAHGFRNVLSGNDGYVIQLYGNSNFVLNNFMGTTADGMNDLGNGNGILISLNDNTIGGAAPLARNVISGNDRYSIYVSQADDTLVAGNYIGVARDGTTPLPNDSHGIVIFGDAASNTIGEGNIIAYSGGKGISVEANGSLMPKQTYLRGNSIHHNADLGIDLGSDGVDTNDPGDGDVGENMRQNYPVLTAVANTLTITGTLNSEANIQYTVDLYRNDSCHASGHGEGQEYLLTKVITTDGNGNAEFTATATGTVDGDVITAVATDPDGNTSEFSACVAVQTEPPDYYLYLPIILK